MRSFFNRKKAKKNRVKNRKYSRNVLLIVLIFSIINIFFIFFETKHSNDTQLGSKKQNKKQEEVIVNANIIAVGDIMYHTPQITRAYNKKTKTYDFSKNFEKVKKYFKKADLVVGNYEGTLASEHYPLSGYPLFNAPDEVINNIKAAGFNVLSTCNNHSLDSRSKGVISTIEKIEHRGIDRFGTYKSKEDREKKKYLIKDIKGIKVGFLAYSYGFNGMEQTLSKEELSYMVNFLNPTQIKEDIENIKKAGAEFVIIYPHWGEEYHTTANAKQKTLAKDMIEWGADMVLGSHPHVLQESETIEKDGKKKFIIYSMGNFISNQRYESMKNRDVETGVMVDIHISKNEGSGDVKLEKVNFIPTWVNRYDENGERLYQVLPTDDFLEGGELRDSVNKTILNRILKAREDALKIINKK